MPVSYIPEPREAGNYAGLAARIAEDFGPVLPGVPGAVSLPHVVLPVPLSVTAGLRLSLRRRLSTMVGSGLGETTMEGCGGQWSMCFRASSAHSLRVFSRL
jgi:hypothetical protein